MTIQPKFRVVLFWDLDMDVFLTSKIVTGAVELAKRGAIALETRIGVTREETKRPEGCAFVWLKVDRLLDHRQLNIALDLHDLSTLFYEQALHECDVYLKKSFYPPDTRRFGGERADKIIPFGFNFACSTGSSKRAVNGWLMRLYSRMALRSPRQAVLHMRRKLPEYRTFLDGPTMRDFEQSPDVPVKQRVVFQTRVWSKEEVGPDDHEVVNSLRVGIIRELQRALGDQFIGGLVPTEYARQHYPDVLASNPARRQHFIRWSKRNLVGVYVRGLNYSYGFRFAEHLAASQCVVAHPDGFRNPAPVPPQEGVHYLPFTTQEECVARCRQLFDDSDLAARMREANWRYYRQEVEPARHVWNCLERAFAHADDSD